MQNWTYAGRADFGADPGVSLGGYTFNEVLAIATVSDFPIYRTGTTRVLDSASMLFYWVPNLGEVQLAKSYVHYMTYDNLLVTVLFKPTAVRTFKVRVVNRSNGSTTNYNTAAHGYIDVYCR